MTKAGSHFNTFLQESKSQSLWRKTALLFVQSLSSFGANPTGGLEGEESRSVQPAGRGNHPSRGARPLLKCAQCSFRMNEENLSPGILKTPLSVPFQGSCHSLFYYLSNNKGNGCFPWELVIRAVES